MIKQPDLRDLCSYTPSRLARFMVTPNSVQKIVAQRLIGMGKGSKLTWDGRGARVPVRAGVTPTAIVLLRFFQWAASSRGHHKLASVLRPFQRHMTPSPTDPFFAVAALFQEEPPPPDDSWYIMWRKMAVGCFKVGHTRPRLPNPTTDRREWSQLLQLWPNPVEAGRRLILANGEPYHA